jgi:hypothetical protein
LRQRIHSASGDETKETERGALQNEASACGDFAGQGAKAVFTRIFIELSPIIRDLPQLLVQDARYCDRRVPDHPFFRTNQGRRV